MEFQFNVNEYFKRPIVEIGNTLLPPDFAGDRRALWNTVNKVAEVVNEMGEASAHAQGLNKPITTAERLRQSDQNLYLLVDHGANNGNGAVTGMLKIGRKGLYVFDREGQHFQVTPPCVLDFYVHEKRQRSGLGKKLFEYMLDKENVKPHNLAIDRPSEKFLNFLHKHYYLQNPIKQMNNYVVFDGFFPENQKQEVTECSPISRTNGLQSTQSPNSQPLYGRYGAPRPPCSMGQIIHNTTAQKNSEPTSPNNFKNSQDAIQNVSNQGYCPQQYAPHPCVNETQKERLHPAYANQEARCDTFQNNLRNEDLQKPTHPQQMQQLSQKPYIQEQIRMFPERETHPMNMASHENVAQTTGLVGNVWPGQTHQQVYQMAHMPARPSEQQYQQLYEPNGYQNITQDSPMIRQSQQNVMAQQYGSQSISSSNIQQNTMCQPYCSPQNVGQQPMMPRDTSMVLENDQGNAMSQQYGSQNVCQQSMIPQDASMVLQNNRGNAMTPQYGSQPITPQDASMVLQNNRGSTMSPQYGSQNVCQQPIIPQDASMVPQNNRGNAMTQQLQMENRIVQQPIESHHFIQLSNNIPQQQSQSIHYPEISYNRLVAQNIQDRQTNFVQPYQDFNRATHQTIHYENQLDNAANSQYLQQHHEVIPRNSVNAENIQHPQVLAQQQSPHYCYQPGIPEQYQQYVNRQQTYQPPQHPNVVTHQVNQHPQLTYSSQEVSQHHQPRKEIQPQYTPSAQTQHPKEAKDDGKNKLRSETVHSLLQVDPKYFKPDPVQIRQPSSAQAQGPIHRARKEETVASLLNAEQEFFENGLLRDKFRVPVRQTYYDPKCLEPEPYEYPRQTPVSQRDARQFVPQTHSVPQMQSQSKYIPQTSSQQEPYHDFPVEQQFRSQQHQPRTEQFVVPRSAHSEEQKLYQPATSNQNQPNLQYTSQDQQCQQPKGYNPQYQEQTFAAKNQYDLQQQAHNHQQQAHNHQQRELTQQTAPTQMPSERQYQTDDNNGMQSSTNDRTQIQQRPTQLVDTTGDLQPVKPQEDRPQECVGDSVRENAEVPVETTEKKGEGSPPTTIRQSSYIANDFIPHPDGSNKVLANPRSKSSKEEMLSRRKDINRQYGLNEIDMRTKGYKSAIIKRPTDLQEIDTLEYGYPPQVSKNVTMPSVVAESVHSSQKLERPKSLEIQSEVSVQEPQVPPEMPTVDEDDGIQDDIEPELEKLRIDEDLTAPSASSDKESGKKTPRHLTEQGYFDLKFYHNKLW